ncbi:hypothetical protein KIL84_017341 [Mauremys mutica]|uniref:Uncharacterized protein n=1 Tax=Mauremys mutica TaxID=74926 RepID=A0A9D4ARJ7_9SAUR|nr:hypothetical protein KIL84_017341 [Mauremys mutica]
MLFPGRAAPSGSAPLSFVHLVSCLLAASAAAAAGPTFLVTGPRNIRPGANVTIGVALLTDSPPQVTVRDLPPPQEPDFMGEIEFHVKETTVNRINFELESCKNDLPNEYLLNMTEAVRMTSKLKQLYILKKVMFGALSGRDLYMTEKYPITHHSVQAGNLSSLPGLTYTLGNSYVVLQVLLECCLRLLERKLNIEEFSYGRRDDDVAQPLACPCSLFALWNLYRGCVIATDEDSFNECYATCQLTRSHSHTETGMSRKDGDRRHS